MFGQVLTWMERSTGWTSMSLARTPVLVIVVARPTSGKGTHLFFMELSQGKFYTALLKKPKRTISAVSIVGNDISGHLERKILFSVKILQNYFVKHQRYIKCSCYNIIHVCFFYYSQAILNFTNQHITWTLKNN